MDASILAFLKHHRISVIGVLQEDGTVHSATLHYAHSSDPVSFYFLTGKQSRKARPLAEGKETPGSLVIGFSEEEFCTFQAEGTITISTDESGWEAYVTKYPNRSNLKTDPEIVLLKFTPTWYRYTDMKTKPPTTISSEA